MKEPEIDDLKKVLEGFPAPRSRGRTPARLVAGRIPSGSISARYACPGGIGLARDPYCGALLFPGNHSRAVVPPVRKE